MELGTIRYLNFEGEALEKVSADGIACMFDFYCMHHNGYHRNSTDLFWFIATWYGSFKSCGNVQCLNKIETLPAWKSATKVMSNEQKQSIQTEVCGCVSEKAPYSVTTMDIATASLDPAARATIVNQIVTKTVSECVVQTLN